MLFFPPQKLTNVRIMKENMRTGNLPANMKKNRVLQIIPCTVLMWCSFKHLKHPITLDSHWSWLEFIAIQYMFYY